MISRKYRSYKHPILEDLFKTKRVDSLNGNQQKIITFTYNEIRTSMEKLNIRRSGQASISNFVIDLTRQDRGIESRVPKYVSDKGYDLANIKYYKGQRIAGAFLFVGIGNEIQSWVEWPNDMPTLKVDSNPIPKLVLRYLRKDEGALFSVMDYCNIMSKLVEYQFKKQIKVIRVQNPLKWQPHEIDGLYVSENPLMLIPVEAKALTTQDHINLLQLRGEMDTIRKNYPQDTIFPISCQMIKEGMKVAFFPQITPNGDVPFIPKPFDFVKIILEPRIESWFNVNRGTSSKVSQKTFRM